MTTTDTYADHGWAGGAVKDADGRWMGTCSCGYRTKPKGTTARARGIANRAAGLHRSAAWKRIEKREIAKAVAEFDARMSGGRIN